MQNIIGPLWIAICADQLQQLRDATEISDYESIARMLWHDAELRAMVPADAAQRWTAGTTCLGTPAGDRRILASQDLAESAFHLA